MGCSAETDTGSVNGENNFNKMVGTWNLVSSSNFPEGNHDPQQLIFNSNGSGSFSGASGNPSSGSFAWNVNGFTLALSGGLSDTLTIHFPDNNNLAITHNGTAKSSTYRRG
jgi:hypothetical protein